MVYNLLHIRGVWWAVWVIIFGKRICPRGTSPIVLFADGKQCQWRLDTLSQLCGNHSGVTSTGDWEVFIAGCAKHSVQHEGPSNSRHQYFGSTERWVGEQGGILVFTEGGDTWCYHHGITGHVCSTDTSQQGTWCCWQGADGKPGRTGSRGSERGAWLGSLAVSMASQTTIVDALGSFEDGNVTVTPAHTWIGQDTEMIVFEVCNYSGQPVIIRDNTVVAQLSQAHFMDVDAVERLLPYGEEFIDTFETGHISLVVAMELFLWKAMMTSHGTNWI